MKLIWKRMKIVMEPSSAVPLATILKNRDVSGEAGRRDRDGRQCRSRQTAVDEGRQP
jgi:hypothetical protein